MPDPVQLQIPNLSATAAAKQGALIQLSTYVIAVDAKNVAPAAQSTFGNVQRQAAKVLLATLEDYDFPTDPDNASG